MKKYNFFTEKEIAELMRFDAELSTKKRLLKDDELKQCIVRLMFSERAKKDEAEKNEAALMPA